jgi:hypothetical protein
LLSMLERIGQGCRRLNQLLRPRGACGNSCGKPNGRRSKPKAKGPRQVWSSRSRENLRIMFAFSLFYGAPSRFRPTTGSSLCSNNVHIRQLRDWGAQRSQQSTKWISSRTGKAAPLVLLLYCLNSELVRSKIRLRRVHITFRM